MLIFLNKNLKYILTYINCVLMPLKVLIIKIYDSSMNVMKILYRHCINCSTAPPWGESFMHGNFNTNLCSNVVNCFH